MSNPVSEGANTTEMNDNTHSLTGLELEDVNFASSSQSTSVTSVE